MIDHFAHFDIGKTFDLYRVPMLLVHVIARTHFLVAIAQIERKIGIAFQIRSRRDFIERH